MGRPTSGIARVVAALLANVPGCERAGAATTSGAAETSSAADSTGGVTGETTYTSPSACAATDECADGFCVAPYDAGAGTGAAGMGAPVCVPQCVPADALQLWCLDDAACCAGLRCNEIDGLCGASAGSSSTVGESWATLDTGSDTGAGTTDTGAGSTTGDTGTGTGTSDGTSA